MKHLLLRLLVLLVTFSTGVAVDRLTSKLKPSEKAATNVSCEARGSVAPASHFQFRGESAVSVSTKPTLIFDYDPNKFWPEGDYAIVGKRPKGLSRDDYFFIEIWRGDHTDEQVQFSIPDDRGSTDLRASFALVTEKQLFFVTQPSPEGFVYRFEGEFLRRGVISDAPEGRAVLKGRLIKAKDGRSLAEWPMKFEVVHDGC